MKQELSSLDLHFLIKEFKILETGRIDKIYQWGKKEFVFRVYTKEGKKHLRISLPSMAFLTEKSYETPMHPPGYCEFLRKYLSNAIIKSVKQKGFERILEIELEKKETYKLIIELIKPGNIILTKEGTIMNPLEQQTFKDRKIRAKQPYDYPPEQFNTKENKVTEDISKSDKSIVKTLATDLGLGGSYAEEILKRLNIDKKLKANEADFNAISKEIKKIFNEKVNPFLAGKEIFPIKMQTKEPEKTFPAFNEAIDSVIEQIQTEEKDVAVQKQDSILTKQRQRLTELEEELNEAQKTGEYIYEHYQEFESLLNQVKELRKTKSFKEIKKLLKKNKHFKELNEKEKKVMLEF